MPFPFEPVSGVASIENLVASARPSDMPDRVPRGQCAQYVGFESKDDVELVKFTQRRPFRRGRHADPYVASVAMRGIVDRN